MKNNLLIKLLVLLIAILLWIQQVMARTHTISLDIPIQLLNIPADLSIENFERTQIPVKVRAKGMDIISASLSQVSIDVDASNYLYGKNKVWFTEKNIHYSDRIQLDIIEIQNDRDLLVVMDKIAEKTKPVTIEYASAKDEEFFIENKIINDQQVVTIIGPLAVLSEIDQIKTEPISRKMVADGKMTVSLIKPFENVRFQEDEIVFELTQTKIINKTISLIPIKYPETAGISIIPQKVSLMVQGPQELVEKLNNSNIEANLETSKIRKGYTGVSFNLPSGIKIVEYTPQRIQIIQND